jgi:hypothetical protein
MLGWCSVVGSIDGFEGKQRWDVVIKNLLSVGYFLWRTVCAKTVFREAYFVRTQTTKCLYENTNHKMSIWEHTAQNVCIWEHKPQNVYMRTQTTKRLYENTKHKISNARTHTIEVYIRTQSRKCVYENKKHKMSVHENTNHKMSVWEKNYTISLYERTKGTITFSFFQSIRVVPNVNYKLLVVRHSESSSIIV